MSNALKMSEAAAMAVHTMAFLASNRERHWPAKEIAGRIAVSEAHLAKVLQRLARSGLVVSVRGPKGGFRLADSWRHLNLLDVLESIDGPFKPRDCLMPVKTCGGKACIFGDLLRSVNRKVRSHLRGKRLTELTGVYAAKSA